MPTFAPESGLLAIEELRQLRRALGPGRWRACSDVAQVAASYLSAHPAVAWVRYPGLRSDALYARASCALEGGFGPYVAYGLSSGEERTLDCTDETDARALVLALEHALAAQA